MLFRLSIAALLLALAGCTAPPSRGYYHPAGQPAQDAIGAFVEQGPQALVELRCQGAYTNRLHSQRTGTVHLQFDVARTRSGDLVLPRDALHVDVATAAGGPRARLQLSEAWSGRDPVPGDLHVPAWTRRPFDLFFDDHDLVRGGPPSALLVTWVIRGDGRDEPGQAEFVLIPEADPFDPGKLQEADPGFGLRNGYYLPGVQLGERRLRDAGEERLHYLFHEPEGWLW